MASKRRNMFYQKKKQETTEIASPALLLLPPPCVPILSVANRWRTGEEVQAVVKGEDSGTGAKTPLMAIILPRRPTPCADTNNPLSPRYSVPLSYRPPAYNLIYKDLRSPGAGGRFLTPLMRGASHG
ncbi:hypothetical protein AAG570_008641 [Ranatra chinensis]|uniref:Uncharacterized protein n=1 Tax=Ranatra chinensis TaxID=642074 RepID=A0ABD0ZCN1_9HEMI